MVRHAPVGVAGVCYGQRDVATTMDASSAAAVIEDALSRSGAPPWDEIWTSPWERTFLLAAALAERAGPGTVLGRDARLSELAFGEWEGLTYSEIETRDAARFSRWMLSYDSVAPPGGETADALVARVAHFLADVESSGKTVLAVCHAGTIRAARASRARTRFSSVAMTPVPFLSPEEL
jgi:broad specificity phosphatase PhoE